MIRWLPLFLCVLPLAASAARAPRSAVETAVAQGFEAMGLPAVAAEFSAPVSAKTVSECEKFKTPIPWEYCVTRTEGSSNPVVLYYMHGLGGSVKTWTNPGHYNARIRQAWTDGGKQAPVVVTVSFGSFWLLSEKNPSRHSGLLDFFTGQAMPLIEAKLGGGKRARILLGESMGGFNASVLVLKDPGLFERAALVCPALSSISPFADKDEVARYIERTGAERQRVHDEINLAQAVFPDQESWDKGAPLELGKTLLGAGTPPLNVSCGDKDEYGFFEGAKLFADLARANGVSIVWEPLGGGHCSADPEALAEFLLPKAQ